MTMRDALAVEQMALERTADALLRTAPPDPERPVYTERQLERHGGRRILQGFSVQSTVSTDADTRDELQFLASISRLEPFGRTCMRLWIDGWTQEEMARTMRLSQGEVSRQLRLALRICFDHTPITFREFSKHTIYRKPARVRKPPNQRRCRECGETYLLHTGEGRFCSSTCQQTAILSNK